MNNIEFSLIIPVYNSEKYIDRCLDSVVNQNYGNYEVIIVDDGSRDHSSQVIEKYLADSRFRYYYKDNGGVSDARNYGLSKAKANWVMFLDSDDWLRKDALEIITTKISKSVDIIQCNLSMIGEKGTFTYKLPEQQVITDKKEILETIISVEYGNTKYHMRFGDCRCIGGKFYRRSLVENNKISFPVGIKVFEDGIFNLICYSKADTILIFNTPLYFYSINQSSATHIYNDLIEKQYRSILKEIECFMRNNYIKSNSYYYCAFDFLYLTLKSIVELKLPINKKIKMAKKVLNDMEYNKSLDCVSMMYLNRRKRKIYQYIKKENIFMVIIIINLVSYLDQIKEKVKGLQKR